MTQTPIGSARVRVPGSTSNLGPGFDVLGLAVDRGIEVAFEPGHGRLEIERRGAVADAGPLAQDLVVRAFRAALPPGIEAGGRLVIESDIPVARGLGSSAAARVAGDLLGRLACGGAVERGGLLARAAAAEGHADNAAAVVFGGLVAVGTGPQGFRVVQLALSPRVGFAFAEPGVGLRTEDARRALPADVTHAAAAENAGHLAVLLHGLAVADGDLLRDGIRDRLHAPFRVPLIPGVVAAMASAREAGAWAVTISGAGSGLIALSPHERTDAVARAMAAGFRDGGAPGGRAFPLRADPQGARALARNGPGPCPSTHPLHPATEGRSHVLDSRSPER